MRRIHLFELEDQSWFPSIIRDAGTDFLRFAVTRVDQTANFEPILEKLLAQSGSPHLIDLCSGGGGPIESLAKSLSAGGTKIRITLTDFYPNIKALEGIAEASEGAIDFHREPVDARNVPDSLSGVRTMFNSFHHFRPEDAKAILANAQKGRSPIAIVELIGRFPLSFLSIPFNASIGLALITPFIRPFRWSRLLFTYLIPLIPLLVLWDGLVSCLRVYCPAELDELTADLAADDWVWDSGEIPNSAAPIPLTYLIGYPKEDAA
ncbi:MAG: class I SAM-dependent methyltransferase [bacterium]|nr:class I SAM-dependent methyltransferase [bacterium]